MDSEIFFCISSLADFAILGNAIIKLGWSGLAAFPLASKLEGAEASLRVSVISRQCLLVLELEFKQSTLPSNCRAQT